jgi:hypothetical protein
MRLLQIVVIATLALGAVASGQTTVAGKWKVAFTGTESVRPKMFTVVLLDLKIEGDKLSGTATAGDWPGVAPISDGTVKGDHVTFSAVGAHASTTGYPKMAFDGIIQGDELKLTMAWGVVGDDPNAKKLAMTGTRFKE